MTIHRLENVGIVVENLEEVTRFFAFSVDDIDADVAGLRRRGFELWGEVVRYEDAYRLCYVKGPEGIIVMLAEPLRGEAVAERAEADSRTVSHAATSLEATAPGSR